MVLGLILAILALNYLGADQNQILWYCPPVVSGRSVLLFPHGILFEVTVHVSYVKLTVNEYGACRASWLGDEQRISVELKGAK